MSGASDHDLLARFVRQRDEAAFTAIVERYLPLVRSAALRQLRDPHTADDVAQAVFIVLARKAPRLRAPLAGWLLKTTHYCSIDVRKINRRRVNHEQKVAAMREESYVPAPAGDLAEFVDESLAALGQTDRNALALHFLQQEPLSAVAAALGLSQAATRKRIERALRKLQGRLSRSAGVGVGSAAVPALLASITTHGTPAMLATTVSHAALHAGSHLAANSVPALISKGVIHMMNLAKLKIAAGLAFAALAAGSLSYGILRPAFAQNTPAPPAAIAPAPAAALAPAANTKPDNPLGIEIVAVGPYDRENHQWWSPSGEKLDFQSPNKFQPQANTPAPGDKLFEVAVRAGASAIPFQDLTFTNIYSSDPSASGDWSFLCLRVPAGATTTSLRVEYSKGPWKSVMIARTAPGMISMMTVQGNHQIAVAGPTEASDRADLVIVEDLSPGLFVPRRYVAVGKDGHETTTFGSIAMGEKFSMSRVTFQNLKAADIASVRCEVHPLDSWLQFDNISLDGNPTKPGISTGTIPVPAALAALEAASNPANPQTVPPPPAAGDHDLP